MKLPSLHLIYQRAGEVLRRFPLVVLSGAAGAFAFAYQAHLTDSTNNSLPDWVTRLFATSFLALPLTLSGYLFAERRRLSPARRVGLQGAGVALLAAYFLTLNADFDVVTSTRFGLFFVGVHLLVAIAPTPASANPNGFWQFNKVIFLRILLAGLYSVVLFAGTSLALLAIDNLFDVDVRGKWYATVAALVFGVFNTGFFLAGVPENLDELGRDDYPRGLLVFTQFVLLPLVTLYLTILYFYAGKIGISQTLPKGWVSYLVIGFSVAGILSLLLVHPIRQRAENRWIGTFSRWFYLALFPLIGLLFVAIGERIRAYGITENRYFVLLLAGWLTGTALYFLMSQRKNIYWIPASLAILAFLASFGPWGAFRVAERSQLVRLDGLLRKNGLLDGGKIAAAKKAIPFRDNQQISSGLEFFANRNAAAVLQPYFTPDLGNVLDTLNTYERRRELHKLAQIRYVNAYEEEGQDQQHYYQSESELTDVAGFDYLIRIAADRQDLNFRGNRSGEQTYRYPYNNGRDSLLVRLDPTLTTLRFYRGNERLLDVNVGPKMAEILKNHPYADEAVAEPEMTLLVENERCRVRLRFSSLNVRTSGSGKVRRALNYTADALIDVK